MSPAKLEANRQNATLSTGPTSAHGKAVSSRNATTHGLTARNSILAGEDPEEYRQFVDAYIARYRPANSIDRTIVAELADLQWRLRRVPVVETQVWNHEMLELSENPEYSQYEPSQIMAIAFSRLVQNKVLTNLYAQESRLQGRINRIQKYLATAPQQMQAPVSTAPEPKNDPTPAETEICKNEPIRVAPQPGRNELCPCGSGVKFKRCCLNRPQNQERALSAAA